MAESINNIGKSIQDAFANSKTPWDKVKPTPGKLQNTQIKDIQKSAMVNDPRYKATSDEKNTTISFDEIDKEEAMSSLVEKTSNDKIIAIKKVLPLSDYNKLVTYDNNMEGLINNLESEIKKIDAEINALEEEHQILIDTVINPTQSDQAKMKEYNQKLKELRSLKAELSNSLYNIKEVKKSLVYEYIKQSDDYNNYTYKDYNYNLSPEEIFVLEGKVATSPAAVLAAGFKNRSEFEEYSKLYFMSEEDRKTYFYLKDKDSKLADQFFKDREDAINQVRGTIKAMNFINSLSEDGGAEKVGNYLKTFGKGTTDGINSFFEGIYNLAAADGVRSESDYEKMLILQALTQNKEYGKYLPQTYQFSQSMGNMLPSMAASALVTLAFAPAGAAVAEGSIANQAALFGLSAQQLGQYTGTALMGLSAAGNATEQSMQLGHGKFESYVYGAIVGTSEATLEHLIGNIPGLSKTSELSIKGLLNEGLEEGSQEIIDAVLQNVMFDEEIDPIQLAKQSGEAFAMGVAMSLFMNGGQIAINTGVNTINLTINQFSDLYNQGGAQAIANYFGKENSDTPINSVQTVQINNGPSRINTTTDIYINEKQNNNEPLVFYHGGVDGNFTLDDIDVFRRATKQQKRNTNVGGFYMHNETDISKAQNYVRQANSMNNTQDRGLAKITMDNDVNVYEVDSADHIQRMPIEELQQLKDQGYDLVVGKNYFGTKEYVLLNKDKVSSLEFESDSKVDMNLQFFGGNNNSNVEIVDVSKVYSPNEKKTIGIRDSRSWNENSIYEGYDYVVKSNDLNSAISELNNPTLNGNILIEIPTTIGLTQEVINNIPDNVKVRVKGGYTSELLNGLKTPLFRKFTGQNTIYTKEQLGQITTKLDEIDSKMDPSWSDQQKIEFLYKYLRDNIKYNENGLSQKIEDGSGKRYARYESLVGLIEGESTCQGFAHIFKELCDRNNIECSEMGSEKHAYNVVTIDGKNYVVDTVAENLAKTPHNGLLISDVNDLNLYRARSNKELLQRAKQLAMENANNSNTTPSENTKRYNRVKELLKEAYKFEDNNEIDNRLSNLIASALSNSNISDQNMVTIIENLDRVLDYNEHLQIGYGAGDSVCVMSNGTLFMGKNWINNATDGEIKQIFPHELGHFLFKNLTDFSYTDSNVKQKISEAMEDARQHFIENQDEIFNLIVEENKVSEGWYNKFHDQVDSSYAQTEADNLINNNSNEELIKIVDNARTFRFVNKLLESANSTNAKSSEIVENKELLRQVLAEKIKCDEAQKKLYEQRFNNTDNMADNWSFQGILNSIIQKEKIANSNGEETIFKANHCDDYFSDGFGDLTGFDECMAEYSNCIINGKSETINTLKRLLGDKLFNLMDSYYKDIATKLSKTNTNTNNNSNDSTHIDMNLQFFGSDDFDIVTVDKSIPIEKKQFTNQINDLMNEYNQYADELKPLYEETNNSDQISEEQIEKLSTIFSNILKNDYDNCSFFDRPNADLYYKLSHAQQYQKFKMQSDGSYSYLGYDIQQFDPKYLKSVIRYACANNLSLVNNSKQIINNIDETIEYFVNNISSSKLNNYYGDKKFISSHTSYINTAYNSLLESSYVEESEKREILAYKNILNDLTNQVNEISSKESITQAEYEKLSKTYQDILEVEKNISNISDSAWQRYFKDKNASFVHCYSSGVYDPSDFPGKICTSLFSGSDGTLISDVGVEFQPTTKNIDSISPMDAGSWDISQRKFVEECPDSWQWNNDSKIFYEGGEHSKIFSPEYIESNISGRRMEKSYTEIVLNNKDNLTPSSFFFTEKAEMDDVAKIFELANKYNVDVEFIDSKTFKRVIVNNISEVRHGK